MSDWKTERDALTNETTAFARSVRSRQPIPVQQFVSRQLMPDETAPAPPDPTFEEIIGGRRLEPLKWNVPECEVIKLRIANFKAQQQRFDRERDDYATSTLKRMQASQDAALEERPHRVAREPTFGDPTRFANAIITSAHDRQ